MEVPPAVDFPVERQGYGQLPTVKQDTDTLGGDFKLAVTAHLGGLHVRAAQQSTSLPAVSLKSAVRLSAEEHSQGKP